MDLAWLNTLPDPIKEILLGAAGDFSGGLSAQAVTALLGMAGRRAARRFQTDPQRQVLQVAFAQALYETAAEMSDDPTEQEHYLGLLGHWLEIEDVQEELSVIIDPRPNVSLDLELLADAFEEAGFDPDMLGENLTFEDLVSRLVGAFYDAAARQPALQGQIGIGLLRGIAEATAAMATESRKQTQQLARVATGIEQQLHPLTEQAAQAEAAYLNMLRRDCNQLPLAEDDRSQTGQNQRRAQLANVYVDLATQNNPSIEQAFDRLGMPENKRVGARKLLQKSIILDDRETDGIPLQKDAWEKVAKHLGVDEETLDLALRPWSALEALSFFPHLVLLGEPGGGKSTFVNHLAYIFAGVFLGQEETFPAPLTAAFFPLRVILRRWSSTLTRESKPGLDLVYDALSEATGLDREAVLRRLRRPDTLVLFDGLDEAPPADAETGLDRRKLLVLSVQDFCTAHPDCRVLVTSRIKPYDNKSYRLDDLPVVTLAKLDEARIERFVHNWYAERARVDPEKAAKATVDRDRLLRSLSQRPELRRMAETPLLLTMLAAVNAWAGLPESRAELYDKCVEQLLWEWEKRKQDDGGDGGGDGLLDLLHEAGLQRSDLERVLWEMTYAAHAASGSDMADLPARDLREKLAAIHPKKGGVNWAWADRVVALMAERGGLLVETDTGVFSFPHRSFQEYLAARWLLEQEERTAEAAQLAESDTWRETVLLACGALTYSGRFSDVQAIIAELTGGRRFDTPEKRLRLLVGGQAWVEFGPHRARGHTGEELAERVPDRLTQLMQDRHAPPRQRLDAGLLLADLHILPPDLDDFVPIAAVETLGYDFRIAKYPVTNAQFRRFFDQGKGYAEGKPWWTEEAVKDIERWEWNKDWRKGPRLWGNPRFDRETQPVVGVSWYEAVAYCEWLTVQMRTQGKISQNEAVRLPTEDEWVRAARGPHPQPP
jgi:hypothetical protein